MALELIVNGRAEVLAGLSAGASLAAALAALELKADRVAVERNGEIAARDTWAAVSLGSGDRLEIVHFVGGGTGEKRLAASWVVCCCKVQMSGHLQSRNVR